MKLAFIGTGKIIGDALFAVQKTDAVEKTAIFARPHSREKAEKLAEEFGIEEIWTDYAELLANSKADTVYIGLINSAHYCYAKEALLAKKHVILEKPFTGFADEAAELRALAKENGVYIFEAITVLHNDIIQKMEANLSKLGEIRMVLANYSQYSSAYNQYLEGESIPHSFDPAFYGGALVDINVYNLHYCLRLFGKPEDATYYPNLGPNGIDTSGTLVLSYSAFSAVCTGAKDSDSPCYVQIQGEKGWMKIDGKPNAPTELITVYVDPDDDSLTRDSSGAMVRATIREVYEARSVHHRMTPEFEEFASIIDGTDSAAAARYGDYIDETVQTVQVLEKAREKAGIGFKR